MNKKLIISDLSLIYGDKNKILSNVNFDLKESEIGCILGPSGCGKTSLLRAIAGFENIISGTILKDGVCISNSLENTSVQDRKMGMVFQSFALLPHKTVLENIAFPLQIKGNSKEESIKRGMEMVKLVVLDGR